MQFEPREFEEDLFAHDTFRNHRIVPIVPDPKTEIENQARYFSEFMIGLFLLVAIWGGAIAIYRAYWPG